MNGDEKKLAQELFSMWTKQHDIEAEQRNAKIDMLFSKFDILKDVVTDLNINMLKSFGQLKCQTHIEKLKWLSRSTNVLWTVIIVSGVLGIALWLIRSIVT